MRRARLEELMLSFDNLRCDIYSRSAAPLAIAILQGQYYVLFTIVISLTRCRHSPWFRSRVPKHAV